MWCLVCRAAGLSLAWSWVDLGFGLPLRGWMKTTQFSVLSTYQLNCSLSILSIDDDDSL